MALMSTAWAASETASGSLEEPVHMRKRTRSELSVGKTKLSVGRPGRMRIPAL